MTTKDEAENLAQRLQDSHGGVPCVAVDVIRKQADEIERLQFEVAALQGALGNEERKDALLRQALDVLESHQEYGSPTLLAGAKAVKAIANIKTEFGEQT